MTSVHRKNYSGLDLISISTKDTFNWQVPGKREKEVFANLFALDALQDTEKLRYLREHFPELMQVYEEMLFEMGI